MILFTIFVLKYEIHSKLYCKLLILSNVQLKKMFQYYANREKLRSIGREDELEKLNRTALKIAKKVAVRHNKLTAAGLCNTPLYVPGDDTCTAKVKEMFKVGMLCTIMRFILGSEAHTHYTVYFFCTDMTFIIDKEACTIPYISFDSGLYKYTFFHFTILF